jgi:SAM-dependent methyltransferase
MDCIMNIMRFGRRMHDSFWDMRLNISSCRQVEKKDVISSNKDGFNYAPTGYFLLQRIMKKISIKETDVFADYGCGIGRVVCFAARFPFKKVYGIELYSDIAAVAKRNSQRLRKPKASIEIIGGCDVLDFDCKDVTYFFFFNPFGEATMRGVLKRIHASLLENPRHIQMIYFNPKKAAIFDECNWLKKREDSSIRTWGGHVVLFYENIPKEMKRQG